MAKGKLADDEIKLILSLKAEPAQQEILKTEKSIRSLEQSNKTLRKEMTLLAAQGKKETEEYRNLDKALKSNNNELSVNRERHKLLESTLGLENMTMKQLQKRAQELQKQMNNTAKNLHPEAYAQLEKELKSTNAQMGVLKGKAQELDSVLKKTILNRGTWATFFGNIFTQAANFLGNALKEGYTVVKDFEQANANLASVLGTTRKSITDLTDEAKRLGETTVYTASQVTLLQTELAKLGFDKKQIIDMTEYVLQFATATGAQLPEAAALAGSALRAFGLQSNEIERVVSTMAVATSKSALDFGYLQTAMSTVAPVAKTFGFSIEKTTALLGALANSGFDASTAATSTRNILLNLADANGKLAQSLGRPVKSLDDLVPAFIQLKNSGVDLNETLELTDKRSVAAFNTFLDNAQSINTLRDSITGAGDDLEKMVETRMDTLQGSTLLLQSAWQGLMLSFSGSTSIFKKLIDALTWIIGQITLLVTGQSKYQKSVELFIKTLLYTISVIGIYVATVKLQVLWNTRLATAISLTNIQLKAKALWLASVRIATLAYNAAAALLTGNITRARAAMHLFNQTVKANPLGLLLSVVAAVAIAIYELTKKTKELTAEQQAL
jgi:TP901 family phage tail tape measure protein